MGTTLFAKAAVKFGGGLAAGIVGVVLAVTATEAFLTIIAGVTTTVLGGGWLFTFRSQNRERADKTRIDYATLGLEALVSALAHKDALIARLESHLAECCPEQHP